MGGDNSKGLARQLLVVIAVFALLTIPARDAFGVRGVEVSLALAIGFVALLAYLSFSGRSLTSLVPAPRQVSAADPAHHEVEWRSDRWVREAVEHGWRALEEWRLEQRGA